MGKRPGASQAWGPEGKDNRGTGGSDGDPTRTGKPGEVREDYKPKGGAKNNPFLGED